jgi:hypothetical protein
MNRHIQTIFCDDIRHEMGGKLSYIGVYSGRLFVSKFPVTLPKLCLALNVMTPASEPFRSLSLSVLKNEELIAQPILDEAQLTEACEAAVTANADMASPLPVLMANFLFIFSPFILEGPCLLQVRAETESEELQGIALRIEQALQVV